MIAPEGWIAVAIGLMLAGVVKGATGIGYATFALPVLANIVGLKSAMALVVAPTLAANMGLAISAGYFSETVRRFAPLYAAMLPGVAAGAALLVLVDQRIASAAMGSAMILYAMLALVKPRLALSEKSAERLRAPVGFVNGVLTGLTGSQVIPLVPYMLALHMGTTRTLQAINIGVLILSTTLGTSLLVTRAVEPTLLFASLLAVVPALAGSALGTILHGRLRGTTLRALVLVIVGLGGARMLVG